VFCRQRISAKNRKNIQKKFGENKKVRIFAARLRKNGVKTLETDRTNEIIDNIERE
jgi:hypothetical protein